MQTINRIAAVVRPKEPYFEWIKSLDGSCPRSEFGTVYLLRESDNLEASLKSSFGAIFAEQLASWDQRESSWPRKRSYGVFQKWFDVELIDMVFDACEGEIVHD